MILVAAALASCSRSESPPAPSSAAAPAAKADSAASAPAAKEGAEASATATFAATRPEQIASIAAQAGGRCAVDSINRQQDTKGWEVPAGSTVLISGWLLDSNAKTTSDWAVVQLHSTGAPTTTDYYAVTTSRTERDDLKSALGDSPGMRHASFEVNATTSGIPPGTYKLLLVHQPASAAQVCDSGRTLTLK